MLQRGGLLGLVLVGALGAQASPLESRAVLTPQALAELERVGAPVLSPDATRVAYTVTGERLGVAGATVRLMVAPSSDLDAASTVLQLDRPVDQLSWSEDGRQIYYVSGSSGSLQLWAAEVHGGRPARQVTRFPLGVISYRLVDHDRLLVTAHDAWPDCGDLACNKARLDQDAARRQRGAAIDNALSYRDGQSPRYIDGYVDDRFVTLFQSRLGGDQPVTDATAVVRGYRYDVIERNFTPQIDFSVSGDGQRLFVALRPSGSNQTDELPKRLFEARLSEGQYQALETPPGRSAYRPRLSPDGRHLAFLQAQGSEHTAPRITMWVRDLKTQRDRALAPQLDVQVTDLGWSSDGQTLYATGTQGTQIRLFELSMNQPDLALPVASEGSVLQWSTRGRRLEIGRAHV